MEIKTEVEIKTSWLVLLKATTISIQQRKHLSTWTNTRGNLLCKYSYLKQVPINKLGYFGGEIETVLKSWKWYRKEIQRKILIFIECLLKVPTIRSVGNGEGNSLFLRKRFCISNPHEQITDLIELINCIRLVTYLAI